LFKYIKENLKKIVDSRQGILVIIFFALALILMQRLFLLQITNGEDYLTNFTLQIKKEPIVKSTRGEIYDRNGKPLAYNRLAYSVTFEDSNSYNNSKERNLSLNSSMYGLLRLIEDNGNDILMDFGIYVDSAGNYSFTIKNQENLERFKADIYGQAYVKNLKKAELEATAEEMMMDLCSKKWYGILNEDYTDEELLENGLPPMESLDKETILKLVIMRSKVAANSYQKYITTTIAKDVSEKTVALIMENKDVYAGVDVLEESVRVYTEGIYFSSLLGYTGEISPEELREYNENGDVYKHGDIVGKTGLEQTFESTLQGIDGSKSIYVDNLGKILKTDSEVAPIAGGDLHLTIDTDLQIAGYKILEQRIAGIVYNNMIDEKEFNTAYVNSSDDIRIPVYDVYYALFENNILDATQLASENASAHEKGVYQAFLKKSANVFTELKYQMTTDTPMAYNDYASADDIQNADIEWQNYFSYIVKEVLSDNTGILNADLIDNADEIQIAWKKGSISLQEYLSYAITMGWLDVSKIDLDTKYLDSREISSALADYLCDYLSNDDTFSQKLYKYMIKEESLSGRAVCLLLFDQGILAMNQDEYRQLEDGTLSAYSFIKSKILKLELTPAQLALEPCSGSLVIVDPNTGDVLACVTYPSYDNNRLANTMDSAYYNKLNADLSTPFYNKATQETIAPGSTFKMITAIAGVGEGAVGTYEPITCNGKFEEADPPINCWIYSERHKAGAHGDLTMLHALEESCNYYFNTIGYRLGLTGEFNEEGNPKHVPEVGMEKLIPYAEAFGLDSVSGIEVSETPPSLAGVDPIRTSMGQGNLAFSTTQLAKYVTAIANNGTAYDLTLIDKITNSKGEILEEPEPVVSNKVDLSPDLWDTLHAGMNLVTKQNVALENFSKDLNFEIAGKTGTAQQSNINANHALFVGYAPYVNPEMAIAVRITNGYSSKNAAAVAGDIIKYQFNLDDEENIITGNAIYLSDDKENNARTD